MQKKYFISGIGTEVGKTVVSAILTEHLKADYWKPVQAGDLDNSDSIKVKKWISNTKTTIHREQFRLNTPASPHYAAQVDDITIELNDFKLPQTDNHLLVEGAGGLLVPLNDNNTILDLIIYLNLPVILVANYYLGSINHTLLSINILKNKNIPISAVVFTGETTASSRDIIIKQSGLSSNKCIDIPLLKNINTLGIKKLADNLSQNII